MPRKHLVAFALSLVCALGLMPAAALAQDDSPFVAGSDLETQDATGYDLWVGNVEVTEANAANIKGEGISGKVSYDAATNTLTLNNATISKNLSLSDATGGRVVLTFTTYAMYYAGEKALTIELVGNSKVKAGLNGSSSSTDYGIRAGAKDASVDLAFTGNGSLAVENAASSSGTSISCANLTIGSKATVKANIESLSGSAVSSTGAVTVKGTLSATANGNSSWGVSANQGIKVPKGGTLAASATGSSRAYAVSISSATLAVNGSVKAISESENSSCSAVGVSGVSGAGNVTVGASGELVASGAMRALNINMSVASSKLEILAGDDAISAKGVAASKIGSAKYVHVRLAKKANPMTVKTKTVAFSASKLKTKARYAKASKAFTVKNAKGAVSYKATKSVTKNALKKIAVAKNGKVTVKKGTAKGTYKLKVKVTAAGNSTYKQKSKTVTLVVKVKA